MHAHDVQTAVSSYFGAVMKIQSGSTELDLLAQIYEQTYLYFSFTDLTTINRQGTVNFANQRTRKEYLSNSSVHYVI